jgi:hypothetical protein
LRLGCANLSAAIPGPPISGLPEIDIFVPKSAIHHCVINVGGAFAGGRNKDIAADVR